MPPESSGTLLIDKRSCEARAPTTEAPCVGLFCTPTPALAGGGPGLITHGHWPWICFPTKTVCPSG